MKAVWIALGTMASGLCIAGGCDLAVASGQCTVGELRAGEGTGGALSVGPLPVTSAGTGGTSACDCPAPINFIPECHTLHFSSTGCADIITLDGLPCRGGIGTCQGGICAAPNAPGQCNQGPAGAPWVVCLNAGDCPTQDNPCIVGHCPEPGCASCLYVPVQDGTACGTGQACAQGACCDVP